MRSRKIDGRSSIATRSCFIESRSRSVTVSRSAGSFSPSVSKSMVTERRTDFVLPAVSPTDRAALVVKHSHVWTQKRDDLLRLRHERLLVFEKRKNRALDWRH